MENQINIEEVAWSNDRAKGSNRGIDKPHFWVRFRSEASKGGSYLCFSSQWVAGAGIVTPETSKGRELKVAIGTHGGIPLLVFNPPETMPIKTFVSRQGKAGFMYTSKSLSEDIVAMFNLEGDQIASDFSVQKYGRVGLYDAYTLVLKT